MIQYDIKVAGGAYTMLRQNISRIGILGFYRNRQPARYLVSTIGAVNALHPDVFLLYCDMLEEKAAERENTVWGILSKLRKTDSQEKKEHTYQMIAKILQEMKNLTPWETRRRDLIKTYFEECEQKNIVPKYSTYYGLKNTEFPTCIISAVKEAPAAPLCKR